MAQIPCEDMVQGTSTLFNYETSCNHQSLEIISNAHPSCLFDFQLLKTDVFLYKISLNSRITFEASVTSFIH